MPLCAPLSHLFQQDRAFFNQLYADAQWRYPRLEGEQFSAFLLAAVDPLSAAIDSTGHTIDREWLSIVYTAALELVSHKLAGPAAVSPWHNQLWQQFAKLPALLLLAPELGAELSNCLHHVLHHPGGAPQHWLASIGRCAPYCQTPDQLRQVAQIAAWTAGLAHYRHSALSLLPCLGDHLCSPLFNLSEHSETWPKLFQQLQENPWTQVRNKGLTAPAPLLSCGAFSGFGGVFMQPPRVGCVDQQLFAISDQECWELYADAFGSSLQAVPRPAELNLATCYPDQVAFSDQQLRTPQGSFSLAGYGDITSACYCHQTLAVTTSLSHAILLVPLS